MSYGFEVLGIVAIVVLLIADIRAVVLLYHAKKINKKQREQLSKQVKELGGA